MLAYMGRRHPVELEVEVDVDSLVHVVNLEDTGDSVDSGHRIGAAPYRLM